jgi:hypothetical protein
LLDESSAQKRYAGAKAISSDDFFGRNEVVDDGESIASRFRDATAISSADIRGEEESSSSPMLSGIGGKTIGNGLAEFNLHSYCFVHSIQNIRFPILLGNLPGKRSKTCES